MNYEDIKININEYLKENNQKELKQIYDNDNSKIIIKESICEYLSTSDYGLDTQNFTQMIYNELFGLGVIDEILQDEQITDISFNGIDLWLQSNVKGRYLYPKGFSKQEAYVVIEKIALLAQKQFNIVNPILDVEYETLRINAIHESLSPVGRSFAIRVIKSYNVITKDNFPGSDAIREYLEDAMIKQKNVIISGVTGSGKSELQKYLIGHINDLDKIVLISDNNELKLNQLYPQKDIYTWITKGENYSSLKVDFSALIKPALRYNPEWLIISESRGSEAFDMLNAATTGHNIITTLHSNSAYDIPIRLLNMCTERKVNLNEQTILKNIYSVLDIGVHLISTFDQDGNIIRSIKEVVEYQMNIKEEKYLIHEIFNQENKKVT